MEVGLNNTYTSMGYTTMAECDKMDDKAEGGKTVCYKLLQGFGDELPEGKVVHLDEAKGQALVDAGLAEHATPDEASGGLVEEAEDDNASPMIANSVNRLKTEIRKSMVDTATQVMKATRKEDESPLSPTVSSPRIAAELETPIYKSIGDYVTGIWAAEKGNKQHLQRVLKYQEQAKRAWERRGECGDKNDLVVKSPLGMNEGTNSAGGYLVNPEFSDNVERYPHNQVDLLGMSKKVDAKSNTYNQRYINETTISPLSGGMYGALIEYDTAEGASFTSSLPTYGNYPVVLQKNTAFIYWTSELAEDDSYGNVRSDLDELLPWLFLNGNNIAAIQGFGSIVGLLNEPALVTVASSANDTEYHVAPTTCLTWADIAAMWSQVYPECQISDKGMWLFHPGLQSSLNTMTYTFGGDVPAWGLQFDGQQGTKGAGPIAPYYLRGKPAYPCWAMSAPGAAGDIMYVDFNETKTYRKPVRIETSIEFQFSTDQVALRYVDRFNFFATKRTKLTGPSGGSTQYSPYVTRTAVGT
jgi:HK97 family phage major capsid protein